MNIPFLGKLVIVILITVALSEFAPEAVNAILVLILIGVILGNYKSFSFLGDIIGSLGK